MKPLRAIFISAITAVLIVIVAFYPKEAGIQEARIYTFGTYVDIRLSGIEKPLVNELVQGLEAELNTVNHQWHAWRPSLLTKANQAFKEGQCLTLTPSEMELIQLAKDLSLTTQELFHPGIGELISLWGFHRDESSAPWQPPSDEALAAVFSKRPSMEALYFNEGKLCSHSPNLSLDFGGFAKGFGVEEAIEWLKAAGVKDAIVNAGGDLKVIGSAAGRPWRVAIKNPVVEGALAIIEPKSGESVFTSGSYERGYEYQGRYFHHIIDPRTGKPAENAISATVLDPNAVIADAAATALLVAGPEGALALAKAMGLKYWLVMDASQQIYTNPETLERLIWVSEANVTLLE